VEALALLRAARAEGVRITVESCPHYLTFCAEQIPDGRTEYKCAPPIRSTEHRDGLWQGLLNGHIQLVASDHSPAPASLKHLDDGDFLAAWGGISSLQLGLASVWTGALQRGGSIEQVATWMSAGPAALAGLAAAKGTIAVGRDADLVIWDPDEEFLVDPAALEHRHPVTPYAGMRLRGRVHRTLLRGSTIYHQGEFPGSPHGRLILRS
jgi:allantoinase